jgi:hypothetical protein
LSEVLRTRTSVGGPNTLGGSVIDSSYDKGAANIAINKGLLFSNIDHKCLMAKDGKKKTVHSRDTPNTLHLMMRVALVIIMMI